MSFLLNNLRCFSVADICNTHLNIMIPFGNKSPGLSLDWLMYTNERAFAEQIFAASFSPHFDRVLARSFSSCLQVINGCLPGTTEENGPHAARAQTENTAWSWSGSLCICWFSAVCVLLDVAFDSAMIADDHHIPAVYPYIPLHAVLDDVKLATMDKAAEIG